MCHFLWVAWKGKTSSTEEPNCSYLIVRLSLMEWDTWYQTPNIMRDEEVAQALPRVWYLLISLPPPMEEKVPWTED